MHPPGAAVLAAGLGKSTQVAEAAQTSLNQDHTVPAALSGLRYPSPSTTEPDAQSPPETIAPNNQNDNVRPDRLAVKPSLHWLSAHAHAGAFLERLPLPERYPSCYAGLQCGPAFLQQAHTRAAINKRKTTGYHFD